MNITIIHQGSPSRISYLVIDNRKIMDNASIAERENFYQRFICDNLVLHQVTAVNIKRNNFRSLTIKGGKLFTRYLVAAI